MVYIFLNRQKFLLPRNPATQTYTQDETNNKCEFVGVFVMSMYFRLYFQLFSTYNPISGKYVSSRVCVSRVTGASHASRRISGCTRLERSTKSKTFSCCRGHRTASEDVLEGTGGNFIGSLRRNKCFLLYYTSEYTTNKFLLDGCLLPQHMT